MKIITNGYPSDSGYSNPHQSPAGIQKDTDTALTGRGIPHDIIILSTLAGRVDQGLGLLHEFLRESTRSNSPVRLWLLSEQSLSFLLHPGTSTITSLDSANGIFTKNVGILPIYGAATISTNGMEWDVKDWKTEMGGIVSTSNHVLGDKVEVETDHVVLFTIERVRRDEE
jgi:thiamine pyrophosphokinase